VRDKEVNLLYTMVCEQVAQDFHVRNRKNLEVPLTLVLGEERERDAIDHLTKEATFWLQHWRDKLRECGGHDCFPSCPD
jgi:hypothetical protein